MKDKILLERLYKIAEHEPSKLIDDLINDIKPKPEPKHKDIHIHLKENFKIKGTPENYEKILSHAFCRGYGWPLDYPEMHDQYHLYLFFQCGNINNRIKVSNTENIYIKAPHVEISEIDFLNYNFKFKPRSAHETMIHYAKKRAEIKIWLEMYNRSSNIL